MKQMFYVFILMFCSSLLFFIPQESLAVNCVIKIIRPAAWHTRTLYIDVLNFYTKKNILSFSLQSETTDTPAQLSLQKSFDCQANPAIQLYAYYSPVIWSANKGVKYGSKKIYNLTKKLQQAQQQKAAKILITLRFPKDFSDVPDLID